MEERERERDREGDRDRERQRQRDRERDREGDRERDRERNAMFLLIIICYASLILNECQRAVRTFFQLMSTLTP